MGIRHNSAAAQGQPTSLLIAFGGEATSLYNYQLDVTNAGSDWYFENGVGNNGQQAPASSRAGHG